MKKLIDWVAKIFKYNYIIYIISCVFYALVCVLCFVIRSLWPFFAAVLLNIVLVTVMYLFYESRVKKVEGVAEQINSLSKDIKEFKQGSKVEIETETEVEEIDNLKNNLNSLIDQYNGKLKGTVFIDGRALEFDEDSFLHVANKDSLESQIPQILKETSYARSIFMLVRLCGGEDENVMQYLVAKVRRVFPKSIVGIHDKFTLSVLILHIASDAEIEGMVSYLVSNFTHTVTSLYEDKVEIYHCKVGAAIYPNCEAETIVLNAEEALQLEGDINYYKGESKVDINLKRSDRKAVMKNFIDKINLKSNQCVTPIEKFDLIKEILLETAELYGYNHADIFLNNESNKQYQCCFDRYVSRPGNLFKSSLLDNYNGNIELNALFNEDGISYFEDIIDLFPEAKRVFDNYGIQSAYQFLVKKNNNIIGWVSMESTISHITLNFEDFSFISLISQIISQLFVSYFSELLEGRVNMLVNSLSKKEKKYLYVIEKDTYNLTYISDTIKEKIPDIKVGNVCYKKIANKNKPCLKCPLKEAIVTYENDLFGKDLVGSILNYFIAPSIEAAVLVENKEVVETNKNIIIDDIDSILSIKNINALYKDFDEIIKAKAKGYIALLNIDNYNNQVEFISQEEMNKLLIILCNKLQAIGYNDNIYRFNDSTFVFILNEAKRPDALASIEKIFETAYEPIQTGDYEMKFNFHCSLAMFPNDIKDTSRLDRVLNTCRDESIALGLNCTYIYGEKGGRQSERRKYILDFIDDAIAKDKFEIFIQPIVDLSDNKTPIYGEVLLRLRDPQRGFIPPNEFVPIANANDRMFGIEMSILNQVGELWKSYGYNIFHQVGVERISVNISSSSIRNPEFEKRVTQICRKYKFPKNFLQFEINERMIKDNIDDIVNHIGTLKEYGISWSLDNFGTAGSDINKLIEYGFNQVKVDRVFILDIESNERNKISVSFITKAAHKAGISVVAEGVETKEQSEVCKEIGFTAAQGYYYLKPVAVNDYIKYLNFGK